MQISVENGLFTMELSPLPTSREAKAMLPAMNYCPLWQPICELIQEDLKEDLKITFD